MSAFFRFVADALAALWFEVLVALIVMAIVKTWKPTAKWMRGAIVNVSVSGARRLADLALPNPSVQCAQAVLGSRSRDFAHLRTVDERERWPAVTDLVRDTIAYLRRDLGEDAANEFVAYATPDGWRPNVPHPVNDSEFPSYCDRAAIWLKRRQRSVRHSHLRQS